jgi:hypothetical protein
MNAIRDHIDRSAARGGHLRPLAPRQPDWLSIAVWSTGIVLSLATWAGVATAVAAASGLL